MMEGLILVEGDGVTEEALNISLGNAKQLIVGRVVGFGVVVHLAADSATYFSDALRDFAQIAGVTKVLTLVVRHQG